MKKKKIYKYLLLVLIIIGYLSFNVNAYEDNELLPETDIITDDYISSIKDSLDDNTRKLLDGLGLDDNLSQSLFNLSFKDVLFCIKDALKIELTKSVSSLLKIFALILMLLLIKAFKPEEESGLINSVFSCSIIILISVMITGTVKLLASSFSVISKLLLSLIPVITVLLSVSGNVTFSALYCSMMMGFSQLIAFISEYLIIPVTGVYLALIISMNFNDAVDSSRITKKVNNAAVTILSTVCTIFVFLLLSKNLLATEIDGVIYKSGKYLVSSLIPIVGSAVSSVLDSVIGSLGVIKGSVGMFAVIAAVCVNIPVFLNIFLSRFFLFVTDILVSTFDDRKLSSLIESISNCIRFLSVLTFFELITVVLSTGFAVSLKGIQ